MIFTITTNAQNSAMTDQAFHDAYVTRATMTKTPTHQAKIAINWRLVMLTGGLRASGSAIAAIASSAAPSAKAAPSGTGRAPITTGSGYQRETSAMASRASAATTTGMTQRTEVRCIPAVRSARSDTHPAYRCTVRPVRSVAGGRAPAARSVWWSEDRDQRPNTATSAT